MAMRGWVLLGVLLAGTAWAQPSEKERGSFTAITSATTSSESHVCDGALKVTYLWKNASGTFTGNIQQSIDNGTTWTDVSGSSTSTDAALIEVSVPNGRFRPELSACSGCSVVVTWKCVNQR